jgi:hypothetical protein
VLAGRRLRHRRSHSPTRRVNPRRGSRYRRRSRRTEPRPIDARSCAGKAIRPDGTSGSA